MRSPGERPTGLIRGFRQDRVERRSRQSSMGSSVGRMVPGTAQAKGWVSSAAPHAGRWRARRLLPVRFPPFCANSEASIPFELSFGRDRSSRTWRRRAHRWIRLPDDEDEGMEGSRGDGAGLAVVARKPRESAPGTSRFLTTPRSSSMASAAERMMSVVLWPIRGKAHEGRRRSSSRRTARSSIRPPCRRSRG